MNKINCLHSMIQDETCTDSLVHVHFYNCAEEYFRTHFVYVCCKEEVVCKEVFESLVEGAQTQILNLKHTYETDIRYYGEIGALQFLAEYDLTDIYQSISSQYFYVLGRSDKSYTLDEYLNLTSKELACVQVILGRMDTLHAIENDNPFCNTPFSPSVMHSLISDLWNPLATFIQRAEIFSLADLHEVIFAFAEVYRVDADNLYDDFVGQVVLKSNINKMQNKQIRTIIQESVVLI